MLDDGPRLILAATYRIRGEGHRRSDHGSGPDAREAGRLAHIKLEIGLELGSGRVRTTLPSQARNRTHVVAQYRHL